MTEHRDPVREDRLRAALADIKIGTTTGMTQHRIERIVRDADYALDVLERGDTRNALMALRRGFQRAPAALRAASGSPTGAALSPHPDAQHEFRTVCQRCGEYGYLHVAIITDLEVVKVELRAALAPSEPTDE